MNNMPYVDQKKMKELSKGFGESSNEDPIIKKVKGLFSSDDEKSEAQAQLEAVRKKRQALGV